MERAGDDELSEADSHFTADLKSLLNKNWKTAIVIPRASEKREIEGILTDQQIPMSLDIEEGKVVLLDGVLTEGFELSDFNLALITAGDILGRQKLRKYSTSGSRKQIRYFSDLNPGGLCCSAGTWNRQVPWHTHD